MTSIEAARYFARWVRALDASSREIERRVRGRTFDLIFANRTFAWLAAALVSRRLHIPYVIRAGSRFAYPVLASVLPLLNRAAPASGVFYNCHAVERDIATLFECPRYSLPNAVDVRRFAPASAPVERDARRRLGLPLGAPLVGLAARPAPEKGFDVFERVVAEVHRARPEVRFVVAGDFAWRERYEARFSAAGLARVTRFLGRVDRMPDFFRSIDVVILTSHERSIEASPNALLEAMAVERPVVATAVGGVPEIVRDGREGYLVRDGDVSTFAARVVELVDDPRRRDALGRAGRTRVVARHRISNVVEELARNLRNVVAAIGPYTTVEGALPCDSSTRSATPSICSSVGPPSRPSSSSRAGAI